MEQEHSIATLFSSPYKVKVPAEKRAGITQDLIHAYQHRFGDEWRASLTKNLRPSPIPEIAAKHGVSQLVVRSIKHALWLIGTLLQNFGPPAPAEAPVDANDP
jgi:hypothetical protein